MSIGTALTPDSLCMVASARTDTSWLCRSNVSNMFTSLSSTLILNLLYGVMICSNALRACNPIEGETRLLLPTDNFETIYAIQFPLSAWSA